MGRLEDGGEKETHKNHRIYSCSLVLSQEYVIMMPNMYARDTLFGKMVIERGDACTALNNAQDLHPDLEFKANGFFSGTYNAIAGRIKHGTTDLGKVSDKWSALMEFKPTKLLPPPSLSPPTLPYNLAPFKKRQERNTR